MKGFAKWFGAVVALLWLPLSSPAPTIGIGASSPWTISANGATNVSPYRVNEYSKTVLSPFKDGSCCSINDNRCCQYCQGANPADFDGYWVAELKFYLPPTAFNTSLVYSNFYADDRAVLFLNDTIIGSTGNFSYFTNTDHHGEMVFTNGDPAVPFTFDWLIFSVVDVYSPLVVITNGFLPGVTNTLKIIVNNTGAGIKAPMAGMTDFAETMITLNGQISYDPPLLSIRAGVYTNWITTNVYPYSIAVRTKGFFITGTPTTSRFYVQRSYDLVTWSNCGYFGNWGGFYGYVSNYLTPNISNGFYRLQKY